MDEIWHRDVISNFQIKKLAPKQIYADMVAILRNDAPDLVIVELRAERPLKMTQV